MSQTQVKAPLEKLDYTFDWSDWLAGSSPADTIVTSAITVESGITLDGEANTTTTAIATLSGGTLGETYNIYSQITTAAGRIGRRTMKVVLTNR